MASSTWRATKSYPFSSQSQEGEQVLRGSSQEGLTERAGS